MPQARRRTFLMRPHTVKVGIQLGEERSSNISQKWNEALNDEKMDARDGLLQFQTLRTRHDSVECAGWGTLPWKLARPDARLDVGSQSMPMKL